jgi:REP element-mobilizing transposase RayT
MRHNGERMSGSAPLAYFITFRCFGTWLPGDERGWTERHAKLRTDSSRSGHPTLRSMAQAVMAHSPFVLQDEHREIVGAAIRDVCDHRNWVLHALNVRTNHVHLVVSATSTPEHVMTSLKAWSTRRLREAGLVSDEIKPWSRRGSTRYLWHVNDIESACNYVLEQQ